jgi:hypothetical protein
MVPFSGLPALEYVETAFGLILDTRIDLTPEAPIPSSLTAENQVEHNPQSTTRSRKETALGGLSMGSPGHADRMNTSPQRDTPYNTSPVYRLRTCREGTSSLLTSSEPR